MTGKEKKKTAVEKHMWYIFYNDSQLPLLTREDIACLNNDK